MNAEQMKQQYLNFINLHGIAPEEFVIVAGGSMLLRGYRESSEDIDVSVGKVVFYGLVNRAVNGQLNDAKLLLGHKPEGWSSVVYAKDSEKHPSGKPVIQVGEFEIHYDPEFMEKLEFDVIDDVGLQTLESIYELKKKWNRPKDQNDMVFLKYLVEHPLWKAHRVHAGIEILRKEIGDKWVDDFVSVGFELGKRGWFTGEELRILANARDLRWNEVDNLRELLVGDKFDGKERKAAMILEVIEELVQGGTYWFQ